MDGGTRNSRSGSVRPPEPSLINRYANAQDGHICGGISDDGGAGAAFLRLTGARFAVDFFATVFFLAAVFRPADFFAAPFFTAPLRTAFLATTLRALFFAATFFAGFLLAADFFAVFLTAAFAMCCVPINRLPFARGLALCRCASEGTFVFIARKSWTSAKRPRINTTIQLSRAL